MAVVLSTVLVTVKFALDPPQPLVQTADATVSTSVCVVIPHEFVALSVILKVPVVVGVPEIVFVVVAKESPAGRVDVATEKVAAGVEDAVRVYENA